MSTARGTQLHKFIKTIAIYLTKFNTLKTLKHLHHEFVNKSFILTITILVIYNFINTIFNTYNKMLQ